MIMIRNNRLIIRGTKMLIRFKVGNFLSFNEIQEISMIAGATKIHPSHIYSLDEVNLLKLAAIYGANASGKTNLIYAIRAAKEMISQGKIMDRRWYFRPDDKNKETPSFFEFEFEIDSIIYSYGFEVQISKQKIKSEWLYELSSENKIIFQRTEDNIAHEFDKKNDARLNVYIEDMKQSPNKLFLYDMSKKMRPDEEELSIFSKIYKWFKERLLIIDSRTMDFNHHGNEASDLLYRLGTGITSSEYQLDKEAREIYPAGLLEDIHDSLIERKKAGITVGDIKSPEHRFSLSNDDEIIIEKLVFKHDSPQTCFTLSEESDGTVRLYSLLKILLESEGDVTYIVDELDLRLHPQLTYKFIELFVERMKDNKNQLIFTAHESYLIDFDLLRRDEIWFVNKECDASTIYSLEEFNERSDRKLDKAYLEGRYGGVPIFSALFPIMKDRR